ncbi:MAG TPA: hypothetical protein VF502_15600 [Stellaceae bacterium]
MKPNLPLLAALLLCLAAPAYAEDPQGAAAPHEPNPGAPSDAKSGAAPPRASGDQQVAQCGERIKAESQAAGNPASVDEDAAAHERRVRAVVKLYVAEELQKTKNGKGCLAAADAAKELLAAGEQEPASGSTR